MTSKTDPTTPLNVAVSSAINAAVIHASVASHTSAGMAPALARAATVVFADLVGSTGIFETLGDRTASRFISQLTATLSTVFEQHRGQVVKLLGDGLFVVFSQEADALAACVAIQTRLRDAPIAPAGLGYAIQMQMGIESGEVVQIDGDCFGEAVNSCARLADLAGAGQIFVTERVQRAVAAASTVALKPLGPMYLRGKSQPMQVYLVAWDRSAGTGTVSALGGGVGSGSSDSGDSSDNEATVMGVSLFAQAQPNVLHIQALGTAGLAQTSWQLGREGHKLSIGRATQSDIVVNDARVSRLHATVQWRSGYFVLEDHSSYGTWVYTGNQNEAVILRRTECMLVGSGQFSLGCERQESDAICLQFGASA